MLKELINESREVFYQKMFVCESESEESLMCTINEAFVEFQSKSHNCLGCNLQDDVDLIYKFLSTAETYEEKNYFFKIYILLLYVFSEKIIEIMKIIGLPPSYKEEELKVFKIVKLWANFYKHPKAFILTHHPKYYFETDPIVESLRKDNKNKIIDLLFIKKYYRGEDNNKYRNLVGELRNNENVVVLIPSVVSLTQDFCNACSEFIQIIKENKAYKEILNDLSTLEVYFDAEYKE